MIEILNDILGIRTDIVLSATGSAINYDKRLVGGVDIAPQECDPQINTLKFRVDSEHAQAYTGDLDDLQLVESANNPSTFKKSGLNKELKHIYHLYERKGLRTYSVGNMIRIIPLKNINFPTLGFYNIVSLGVDQSDADRKKAITTLIDGANATIGSEQYMDGISRLVLSDNFVNSSKFVQTLSKSKNPLYNLLLKKMVGKVASAKTAKIILEQSFKKGANFNLDWSYIIQVLENSGDKWEVASLVDYIYSKYGNGISLCEDASMLDVVKSYIEFVLKMKAEMKNEESTKNTVEIKKKENQITQHIINIGKLLDLTKLSPTENNELARLLREKDYAKISKKETFRLSEEISRSEEKAELLFSIGGDLYDQNLAKKIYQNVLEEIRNKQGNLSVEDIDQLTCNYGKRVPSIVLTCYTNGNLDSISADVLQKVLQECDNVRVEDYFSNDCKQRAISKFFSNKNNLRWDIFRKILKKEENQSYAYDRDVITATNIKDREEIGKDLIENYYGNLDPVEMAKAIDEICELIIFTPENEKKIVEKFFSIKENLTPANIRKITKACKNPSEIVIDLAKKYDDAFHTMPMIAALFANANEKSLLHLIDRINFEKEEVYTAEDFGDILEAVSSEKKDKIYTQWVKQYISESGKLIPFAIFLEVNRFVRCPDALVDKIDFSNFTFDETMCKHFRPTLKLLNKLMDNEIDIPAEATRDIGHLYDGDKVNLLKREACYPGIINAILNTSDYPKFEKYVDIICQYQKDIPEEVFMFICRKAKNSDVQVKCIRKLTTQTSLDVLLDKYKTILSEHATRRLKGNY